MENQQIEQEIKTLKDQLALAQKDLEKLERIKPLAIVASSVVHDIKNSLGVISSTAQFVLNKLQPTDKEREAWQLVERNVENIKNILKGYLGLARQAELSKRSVSLNDLVQNVGNFIDSQCRKQNIKINRQLDETIPFISIDHTAIESALLNLSINSLEAMGEGGMITFLTKKDDIKEKVTLEIEDNGLGIEAEVLTKIFTPFYTTKNTGTGMGLYSSKAAIEQNGGSLQCHSQIGKGTRMTIIFPYESKNNDLKVK